MSMTPRAWLVSELTTDSAIADDRRNRSHAYKRAEFDALIDGVRAALRDVEFSRTGISTAVVYRKGDTHALGEIGYRPINVKNNGAPNYYVMSRRIKNDKYRENSWQHRIAATTVLSRAVKAAAAYLVPFSCEEAANAGRKVAKNVIEQSFNASATEARNAFKALTGDPGYSTSMGSEFMEELRHHTFLSPKLNAAAAAFYPAFDAYMEAKARMDGAFYYVGITDNYGQTVVDSAEVTLGWPYTTDPLPRLPAEAMNEWMQGRIAVLNMTPPLHYVPGVGLRLDDRVFYVAPQENE